MTTPSRPPPHPEGQSERTGRGTAAETDAKKALPLPLALPAKTAAEASGQTVAEGVQRPPLLRARALAGVLGALVLFAAFAAAVAVCALPWYVRRQCIEVAAAHGIDLSVDKAKIVPEGFRLVGVRATCAVVPGLRAQAPEVDVQTSGLRPQKVTVHSPELTLSGPWSRVDSDFSKWRASASGGQAGEWAPGSLRIEGAHVVWQAPIGDSVRVEAAEVHAEIAWRDRDAELHARSEHVTVGVPGGALGPWRVDIDRAADGARMRVALDPGVPEACTILVVNDNERTTSVDIVIPRSPLAHLGVPDQLLGFGGQGLQIEATIHYAALGPSRADASASGAVHGIEAPGLPRPIDVTWQGAVSGDPTAGIDLKKARLAVGPLLGPLTGTLKRFDDGFRVDLAWAAGPAPCAWFAVPLGLGQPFDIGYELRKLAGVTKMKGDVRATLTVSFDSRDLGATKVDFMPEIGCRGPLFQ